MKRVELVNHPNYNSFNKDHQKEFAVTKIGKEYKLYYKQKSGKDIFECTYEIKKKDAEKLISMFS